MIGTICLGMWMLLIMLDIWNIKKRLDKLEEYMKEKEKENNA